MLASSQIQTSLNLSATVSRGPTIFAILSAHLFLFVNFVRQCIHPASNILAKFLIDMQV